MSSKRDLRKLAKNVYGLTKKSQTDNLEFSIDSDLIPTMEPKTENKLQIISEVKSSEPVSPHSIKSNIEVNNELDITTDVKANSIFTIPLDEENLSGSLLEEDQSYLTLGPPEAIQGFNDQSPIVDAIPSTINIPDEVQKELDDLFADSGENNEASLADLLYIQSEKRDKEAASIILDEEQLARIEAERAEFEEILKKQLEEQKKKDDEKINELIQRKLKREENFALLLKNLYELEESTDSEFSGQLVSIVRRLKHEETIGLTDYLIINRALNKHSQTYDIKEIQSFLSEPVLDIQIPPVDYAHFYYFISGLDKKIPPYQWDKYKFDVFHKAGFRCELCHGVGQDNPVDLYPLWALYDQNRVQMLKGFMALCPRCVDAKNHNLLLENRMNSRYESSREHIKNVNDWSDEELDESLQKVYDAHSKRVEADPNDPNFKSWNLNLTILESLFGLKEIDTKKYHQKSHIPSAEVKMFDDHAKYLFQKVQAYRMSLTGKTRYLSLNLTVAPFKN